MPHEIPCKNISSPVFLKGKSSSYLAATRWLRWYGWGAGPVLGGSPQGFDLLKPAAEPGNDPVPLAAASLCFLFNKKPWEK